MNKAGATGREKSFHLIGRFGDHAVEFAGFGTSICERGYVKEDAQTSQRSRRMLTLALLAAAFLGDPVLAKDKTAGTGADRQNASQTEIRLGMSADFSASARALSIELYRGAMAYLLPLNNAGGVNGRRIVIKAYDDQYEPDLAIRNTLKLMSQDKIGRAHV